MLVKLEQMTLEVKKQIIFMTHNVEWENINFEQIINSI